MSKVTIPMPKVDQTMEEGVLVEWSVAVGAVVQVEDVLAIIETDKVEVEVETHTAGVVTALLVDAGEAVPVGTPICELEVQEQ